MSKLTNPLPSARVARIFVRLTAIYGSQKMSAMWDEVPMDERREVWGQALGRFKPESIAAVVQGLPASASGWPPTLPEFVEMVRVASVEIAQQSPLALPDDSQIVNPETARARLAEIMAKMKRVPS